MIEDWTPEVLEVGSGGWLNVKAPADLPEGGRSLVGQHLTYKGRSFRVRGYLESQAAPIAKGEPVRISILAVE